MTFLMMLSVILLSMLMIPLFSLRVIRCLLGSNNLSWLLNLNLAYETPWTGAKSGLLISLFEKLTLFCLASLITLVLLMWTLWDSISLLFLLDWCSYIIPIAKTASEKMGVLIHLMKFIFSEFGLYLYKYTIRSFVEYSCHVWAEGLSYYLDMLNKLEKWVHRTVGPKLAASFKPLGHRRKLAFLNFSVGISLVDVHRTDWSGFTSLILWELHSLFW